jgi:hypothetical protein
LLTSEHKVLSYNGVVPSAQGNMRLTHEARVSGEAMAQAALPLEDENQSRVLG